MDDTGRKHRAGIRPFRAYHRGRRTGNCSRAARYDRCLRRRHSDVQRKRRDTLRILPHERYRAGIDRNDLSGSYSKILGSRGRRRESPVEQLLRRNRPVLHRSISPHRTEYEAVFRVSIQLRKSPLPPINGQRGFVNFPAPLADCGKNMFLRNRLSTRTGGRRRCRV